MRLTKWIVMSSLAGFSACAPFVLAPGAEQVKLTSLAADVAGCTPAGNIQLPKDPDGGVTAGRAIGQIKNQTIGLNGNVAFVTESHAGTPRAAVVYRCPPKS